jgi:uncharacterized protein YgbK (DUF1537 family)
VSVGTSSLPEIGVLADDLTGALASAVRLRSSGLRTLVQQQLIAMQSPEAVVVNMGTRDATGTLAHPPEHAERMATSWVRHLRDIGCRRIELRVDSQLRGHAGAELRGVLRGLEWPDPWVLAVPAWPGVGRVTNRGRQMVFLPVEREIDVGERLFGKEPSYVISVAVTRQGPTHAAQTMLELGRAGVRYFVADAFNDADLATIAAAAAIIERHVALITVSSGAWLRHHPHSPDAKRGFVVVASGSDSERSERQVEHLSAHRPSCILSPDEVITLSLEGRQAFAQAIADAPTVVVTRDSGGAVQGLAIADRVATSVTTLMQAGRQHGYVCRGIVVVGGFTAAGVMRDLGAELILPFSEVVEFCPMGHVSSGQWTGLPIILKSGFVGDAGTLAVLVDQLWTHQ